MTRARSLSLRLLRGTGRMLRDTRAATAIEYGLILALIVIAMMAALSTVADRTISMWTNISTQVLQH